MSQNRKVQFERILASACLAGTLAMAAGGVSYAKPAEQIPAAQKVIDPLERPALVSHQAIEAVYLDVARAGDRLVIVGERGNILLSDDNGATWRQAPTPVSVTLTAVQFVDPKNGWATGHFGVVLHTQDGGETWTKQFDGLRAAQSALDEANAAAAAKPDDKFLAAMVKNAEYLVGDGPDKPFLDLYFTDANTGFIVGAYGLFFKTVDGGKTWQPWLDHVPNEGAHHLSAIAGQGNMVYLAGEAGLFARSRDGGESFEIVPTPYRGSFFDVMIFPGGDIVLAGLRGNAFWSSDQGTTLTAVQNPVLSSFSGKEILPDGTLYLTNQAGMLMTSTDKGHSLTPVPTPSGVFLTELAQAADGGLVAASFQGPIRLQVGQSQKAGE